MVFGEPDIVVERQVPYPRVSERVADLFGAAVAGGTVQWKRGGRGARPAARCRASPGSPCMMAGALIASMTASTAGFRRRYSGALPPGNHQGVVLFRPHGVEGGVEGEVVGCSSSTSIASWTSWR